MVFNKEIGGCVSPLLFESSRVLKRDVIIMNLYTEISNAFNAHATHYEQAAKIQNEIGQRLFERLELLNISPRYILDLGCGTGVFSKQLRKKYPKTTIVGIDLARAMLKEAKTKQGFIKKWSLVNADMTALPFPDRTFDLVFANQVVHWSRPLTGVFAELNRVMNTNGCLMFSTLGPDTFKELRQAWSRVDEFAHTNTFADMHDVGDMLLQQRFIDPVVDMEYLSVHYPSVKKLLSALKSQGVRNINPERRKGLTHPALMKAFIQEYEHHFKEDKYYPLSYEVVYGHAWKGETQNLTNGTETFISIDSLRKFS